MLVEAISNHDNMTCSNYGLNSSAIYSLNEIISKPYSFVWYGSNYSIRNMSVGYAGVNSGERGKTIAQRIRVEKKGGIILELQHIKFRS